MRRDLVLTAVIFVVVGFVAGYIYMSQVQWRQQRAAAGGRPSPLLELPANIEGELPAGHPPMDVARQIVELRQEAERNPKDAVAAFRLADLLFEIERFADAAFWYERGLGVEPKNIDARVALGICLHRSGRHDEAITQFNTVLELKPNEPEALYELALTLLHGKQDRAAAERIYEQLRRVNPNFAGLEDLERQLAAARKSR